MRLKHCVSSTLEFKIVKTRVKYLLAGNVVNYSCHAHKSWVLVRESVLFLLQKREKRLVEIIRPAVWMIDNNVFIDCYERWKMYDINSAIVKITMLFDAPWKKCKNRNSKI